VCIQISSVTLLHKKTHMGFLGMHYDPNIRWDRSLSHKSTGALEFSDNINQNCDFNVQIAEILSFNCL
jgi:hypothetical protein